jgi:acetoin utilization deacetylase AcuC-like enzyme
MRVSYTPDYYVQLPDGHPFPMGKYPALFDILVRERLVRSEEVIEPHEADWTDIMLVHTSEYLGALASGSLDRGAARRLGFRWTPTLLRRSRLAVQGTIDAAYLALEDGTAANLAGGTHHAFADHGEGYCVLNDVAIAIRVLQRSGTVRRALVIDLDVHQGNGTASIFAGDPSVYTFSIHGENNYPLRKERSSRDVGLPDGVGDRGYIDSLEQHLAEVWTDIRPDVVFYLAGVDSAAGDRYGRLRLTPDGIRWRDRFILKEVRRLGLPIALVLAGGYAPTVEETADLHAIAHREAAAVFGCPVSK